MAYQASYQTSAEEVFETTTAEGPFDKAGLDARFGEGCWGASRKGKCGFLFKTEDSGMRQNLQ